MDLSLGPRSVEDEQCATVPKSPHRPRRGDGGDIFNLIFSLFSQQRQLKGQGVQEDSEGNNVSRLASSADVAPATSNRTYTSVPITEASMETLATSVVDLPFALPKAVGGARTRASIEETRTDNIIQGLREAYATHPEEIEFYLPQLCMCLNLNDFHGPPLLLEFVLELCEGDLRLAHKTHWLLKAYCSEDTEAQGARGFSLQVRRRGCLAATRVYRALGVDYISPISPEGTARFLPPPSDSGARNGGGSGVWGRGVGWAWREGESRSGYMITIKPGVGWEDDKMGQVGVLPLLSTESLL
ncbi:unnamed protein product, partial [Choristocarpus tenellus]